MSENRTRFRRSKKAQAHHTGADLRLKKRSEHADKAPGDTGENLRMVQKDGMTRVYIAITLLLLLLTVSQVCAPRCTISWL